MARCAPYAQFVTKELGLLALQRQVMLDARRGETLAGFVAKYAPAADGNDERSYLRYVLDQLGETDPNRKLYDVLYAEPAAAHSGVSSNGSVQD